MKQDTVEERFKEFHSQKSSEEKSWDEVVTEVDDMFCHWDVYKEALLKFINQETQRERSEALWSLCVRVEERLKQNSIEGMPQMDANDVVKMVVTLLSQPQEEILEKETK